MNDYATNLFRELNEEPAWNSLGEVANRLAYFKSELNMLHLFREVNGRTTRIYIYTPTRCHAVLNEHMKL